MVAGLGPADIIRIAHHRNDPKTGPNRPHRGITAAQWSPTQTAPITVRPRHIASAIPFLGHATDGLTSRDIQRVMFIAKGSLFLGKMTQMSDGFSFILERNPSR